MSHDDARGVHALLHDDHVRLDALFEELDNAAEVGVDKATLGELWTRVDRALRAHLSAEEALLFPLVVDRHPGEVTALRQEHDGIRALLDELGVQVDLHVIRRDTVKAMLARLRAHAAHEDATVYVWSETEVETPLRVRLLASVREALGR